MRQKKQFKSPFEKETNNQLQRSKVAFHYESERLPYVLEKYYVPDFIITCRNGNKIYIECKGYFRPEDKRKLRAVKRCHPDIDLRILFYEYRKEYVNWALRNRIPHAIGRIPKEWLKP